MVVGLGVLTVGTSDLHVILARDGLELFLLVAEFRQLDVHGGAETRAQVSRARGDVAEVVVVRELSLLLNASDTSGESLEDFSDVGAWLHRDDSQLILLINPHKESLVVVVEDTSSLGPVSLKEGRLEILVITLEEEVISGELLLLVSSEVAEGVVLTLKFTGELREGSDDLALDFISLLAGDGGAEGVLGEVSADSDTSGVDHLVLVGGEAGAVELGVVHVGDVLVLLGVTVVLVDDLIEEGSEGVVGVVGARIHTHT